MSIIRPIVIVLLVVMHSFTMFSGEGKYWPLPNGIEPVETYKWIARITYSFMLETFVFISGYLLASQLSNKKIGLCLFCWKKVKRLMLPGIFFSIIYFAIFFEYKGFPNFIYGVLNGTGHMWYLPMIFWCFIAGYILWSVKIPDWAKLLICLFLSIVSGLLGGLPFRLGKSCYYLLFFYLGMSIYPRKQAILSKLSSLKLFSLLCLFLLTFVTLNLLKDKLMAFMPATIPEVIIRSSLSSLSTIVYATLGLLSMYLVTIFWLSKHEEWKPSKFLLEANAICFGVYIYQQFILKILYYKTSFPEHIGTYILPWIGCAIALLLSIILAKVTLKAKLGRFLIG